MKKAALALLIGALFLCPKFHLYKMKVEYVQGKNVDLLFRPCVTTEFFDSDKDYVYGIVADEVEVGDDLLTFCIGDGKDMKVIDYRKLDR